MWRRLHQRLICRAGIARFSFAPEVRRPEEGEQVTSRERHALRDTRDELEGPCLLVRLLVGLLPAPPA